MSLKNWFVALTLACTLGTAGGAALPAAGACEACGRIPSERLVRELVGTLERAEITDATLPPRTNPWSVKTDVRRFGVEFTSRSASREALKLIGRKVRLRGELDGNTFKAWAVEAAK